MARLEPGTHHVSVRGAWMTESSTGTPGIVFKFQSDDGDIECTRWVTPKTRERVLDDLETLGFDRNLIDDQKNLDKIEEITLGNECSIVVEDEEYNGAVTAKVKWINSIGGHGKRTANPETKQRIGNILAGRAVAPQPMRSSPHSVQMPPSGPMPVDEDVPF